MSKMRQERGLAGVMVVEDERIVAQDLANTVSDLGYVVVSNVGSGEEAIARAREDAPDVVLMDIRLAGSIDGIEAANAIRSERDVPIIFLTAHADDETLRRVMETEPSGYLVKPFKAVELRCAIEIALHKHQIEARLRERERWLSMTLRSIGDGVVATDASQRVALLNPVAEALTGWKHDEALGRRLDEIMSVVAVDGSALLDTPSAQVVPRSIPDADAQRRAEEAIQLLNVELELRVQERTTQLQAANRELEAFSVSVAHDLRSPLRRIEGFSQILIEEHAANLGPEGLDHLRRVRTATVLMAQLIEDLLRLSRVANTVLQRHMVDVSAMAHTVVDGLRSAAPERKVVIDVEDGIALDADAGLLRIVLENLIGNAWKFTAGAITPQIVVGTLRQGTSLVLFVRDNGAGFDLDAAPGLFGAFQRFHSAGEFEGNGVGLAIVQRVVNRHGGRIWAESKVGSGAVFYFTL